jgi:hypothetical protein
MKTGIFVTVAALALALFAVPEAHGNDGSDLNLRLAGSNLITSSTEEGRPTPLGEVSTSLQSGIVKGSSGAGIFSAQTIIEEALPDPRCPLELPVGNDLSTTFVLTYADGSILSGTTGPDSFFCSDGVVFSVEFVGIVTGGERRFEGATGTWEGTARAESSRVTAEITVDLD